jgi:hypothetical protein
MQLGGGADFLHSFIWSSVSGLMRFLTADQKQHCKEPHQIASNDATFLSGVITGNESWICSYDPEANQQSSQWKMMSKVNILLFYYIIFYDIMETVHKEFSWQAYQSIQITTVTEFSLDHHHKSKSAKKIIRLNFI